MTKQQLIEKMNKREEQYPLNVRNVYSEQDCMRCEETFTSSTPVEYCPKCSANMNRIDMH